MAMTKQMKCSPNGLPDERSATAVGRDASPNPIVPLSPSPIWEMHAIRPIWYVLVYVCTVGHGLSTEGLHRAFHTKLCAPVMKLGRTRALQSRGLQSARIGLYRSLLGLGDSIKSGMLARARLGLYRSLLYSKD